MIKYISESVYHFEFQMNKLIKYFKEKKNNLGSLKNNYRYVQQYYPDCEVCQKFQRFIGNTVFPRCVVAQSNRPDAEITTDTLVQTVK